MFRNNWWFGQRSGQHTRDSDGPDTVLAIGSTTEGRTVYASFLRGGNEVNEISLEAIHVRIKLSMLKINLLRFRLTAFKAIWKVSPAAMTLP